MKRNDLTPYENRDEIKAMILDLIECGNSRKSIFSRIIKEYGNHYDDLNKLYLQACKEFKSAVKTEKDVLWVKNFMRLEALMDEALQSGDKHFYFKCLDALNKMAGNYTTTIETEINGDMTFEFNFTGKQ